jgi:hypothetical protein
MKVIFDKILGTFREERNVISTTKCTNQIFLKNLRGCGAPVNMPNGINVNEPIIFPTGASNGYVWTTDANGQGSWQPASGLPLPTPQADEIALFFNGWLYVKITDEPGTYTWDDANTVCQNKGAGCYLPTKMELDFIYQTWNQPANGGTYQGGVSPLTGFSSSYYWSSSEYSSDYGWIQYFGYGSQDGSYKGNGCKVRCVRR